MIALSLGDAHAKATQVAQAIIREAEFQAAEALKNEMKFMML